MILIDRRLCDARRRLRVVNVVMNVVVNVVVNVGDIQTSVKGNKKVLPLDAV